MKLLEVKNLRVAVNGREILHGVNLSVQPGEIVTVTGKNGSGKSTLALSLMGGLKPLGGKIIYETKCLTDAEQEIYTDTSERAKLGMFMAFQTPVEIPGVSVQELLRTAGTKEDLVKLCQKVGLDIFTPGKEVNKDFSGGEKKKLELLQMLALKPKLVILDELDSGMDKQAAENASKIIKEYVREQNAGVIIITHNEWILQELTVNRRYEMKDGRLE